MAMGGSRRRRVWFGLAVLGVAAPLLVSTGAGAAGPQVKEPKYGFTFALPTNWRTVPLNGSDIESLLNSATHNDPSLSNALSAQGKGIAVTSAEEDTGYLEALTLLAHAKRVDFDRVMDLRTASDYEVPSQVKTPCSSSPARRLARFPALRSPWNRLTWSAAAW